MRLATVVFLLIGNGLILFWYSKIRQKITYEISLAQNINDMDKKFYEVSLLKSQKYDLGLGFTSYIFAYSLLILNAFHFNVPGFYIVIPIGLALALGVYLNETKYQKTRKEDTSSELFRRHYKNAQTDSENWIIVILGGTALLSLFWAVDYFWI